MAEDDVADEEKKSSPLGRAIFVTPGNEVHAAAKLRFSLHHRISGT